MKKHQWYLAFLLLALILFSGYFTFLYLQSGANIFLGVIVLGALLLPLISSFPFSFSYFLSLPSPVYGTWLLIWMLMEKYIGFSLYMTLSALLLSLIIVYVFHALTRGRTMVWRIPMASLGRTGVAITSILLFGLAMILVNPTAFVIDTVHGFFIFSATLMGYVGTSLLYLNPSYRLFVLSNRLDVLHFENELAKNWEKIKRIYPNQQRDLDLLQYYFSESFGCYLEGNFESSLIWGYKVIREETLVDPREHVDDRRINKPSFGDIRNTLMHSRRGEHVETSRIKEIRKNLFHDCIDLLEREFVLIKRIAEPPQAQQ